MSSDEQGLIHPKWKRRYTIIVAVISAIAGALAFLVNSKQILQFMEDVVPFSVGRLIPGSVAARFDQGCLELFANKYMTDDRIHELFGAPIATTNISVNGSVAQAYQSAYGAAYVERRDRQSVAIMLSRGTEPIPDALRHHVENTGSAKAKAYPVEDFLSYFGRSDIEVFAMKDRSFVSVNNANASLIYRFEAHLVCEGSQEGPWKAFYTYNGQAKQCRSGHNTSGFVVAITKDFSKPDGLAPDVFNRAVELLPTLKMK